ncbi:MAG: tocopherol cyclase family protein [Myxococcales bacterium]|nr:hypothetical protein [Myxococcota bacterium]MDW8283081.1 tocopherol cyclase family protein [Myxococcales bacterium]
MSSRNGFDNHMAWNRQPGHYEVWYITLTHRKTGTGFWIRYTLEAPEPQVGSPYAQLWFCRGDAQDPSRTFGINRRYPIDLLEVGQDPFSLRIGPARMDRSSLSGIVRGGGHEASWDLRFLPATRTHFHLPSFAYARGGSLVDTVVFSPNLSIPLRGTITVDGQTYDFDGDPGGQTHLWGRKHAYAWAWAHCNAFDTGDNHGVAVLEALTVQLRRGPVVLPKLTVLSVYPDGLSGEELAFKEPWQIPLARSSYRTGSYHLLAKGPTVKVEATLTCRPEDMVLTEYVDPDGEPAYCHNTVVSSCDLRLWRRRYPGAPWRPWRHLSTRSGAHWEWGGRAGDSQVSRRHVTVEDA